LLRSNSLHHYNIIWWGRLELHQLLRFYRSDFRSISIRHYGFSTKKSERAFYCSPVYILFKEHFRGR
jgi:hypothetical protein